VPSKCSLLSGELEEDGGGYNSQAPGVLRDTEMKSWSRKLCCSY